MYPGRRTRAGRRWALPLRAAVSSGQWPPPVTSHLKIKWWWGGLPGSQQRPQTHGGPLMSSHPLPLQGPAPPQLPGFPFPGGGRPAAGGWKLGREGPAARRPPATAPHPGLRQAEHFCESLGAAVTAGGTMSPFSPVQERGQRPGEGQGGVRRGQWRRERRGGGGQSSLQEAGDAGSQRASEAFPQCPSPLLSPRPNLPSPVTPTYSDLPHPRKQESCGGPHFRHMGESEFNHMSRPD